MRGAVGGGRKERRKKEGGWCGRLKGCRGEIGMGAVSMREKVRAAAKKELEICEQVGSACTSERAREGGRGGQ